jgi:hypothetical protein
MSYAIVDRDLDGVAAVLMIVDEEPEAETIMNELRQRGVHADVVVAELGPPTT